jgi:hypothetical protein
MKFTRRNLIEAGVLGSIAISTAGTVGVPQDKDRPTTVSDRSERDLLRVVMDEIIPAGEGMPAASEVGSVDHLDRLMSRDPQIAGRIRESVVLLERLSREQFQSSFGLLPHDKRLTVLKLFERRNAASFSSLRDFIYEAYYVQPRVWELVGYECFTTNGAGPRMTDFDENLLAKVKTKPRNYREV